MRKLFLLFLSCFMGTALFAQYPTVTISDIQMVSQQELANCQDTSHYYNDTVTVHGVVVMDGGLSALVSGRQIWIQDGSGPWSGIDVYYNGGGATSPDDILDLVAGDSVKITGYIIQYQGETELVPLSNGVELLDNAKTVHKSYVDVADLNDDMRNNILETGEQWEGVYVTLRNVTVSSIDYFSGGSRVSFNVADANGNLINISDRFPSNQLSNGFTPPPVNAVLDSISGVIAHSRNGNCTGGSRGYEMYPFTTDDLYIGISGPLISSINRNPLTPTSSQDVTVRANIEDPDGTVSSAELFYAIGIGNTNYNSVAMTNSSGTTYEGVIPSSAFNDGDFVKYYISALDNDNTPSNAPDVPSGTAPIFFFARDNGLSIYDLQFTPYSNGNSGYNGLDVTVTGIVTGSSEADNLGAVFIQQANTSQTWTGIQLVPGAAGLTGLAIGDSIEVNGTIEEDFGFTRMQVNVLTNHGTASSSITPKEINPDDFTSYDFMLTEAYEGMLVTLRNPTAGNNLFVVDRNTDAPNNNFGEYRVGTDEFEPLTGCRVLAGRKTGSAPGSLNFSYVNDSSWVSNSGMMNVPPCVVVEGDLMASMTGIMLYSFGNMKLLPRTNADMEMFRGTNCAVGVSIEDELLADEVVLFPNPASQSFQLAFNFENQREVQVRVIDVMGRQMEQASFKGDWGTLTFDAQSWSQGTYFVQIQTSDDLTTTKKVYIQR